MQALDATTIVFAILAVFVVWKLRSVLGTRTGTERPPVNPFEPAKRTDAAPSGTVIPLPGAAHAPVVDRWAGWAPAGSPVARGLDDIARVDSSFTADSFVEGARGAYEMVVKAFAAGDRATLKPLLSPDVYRQFDSIIASRESRQETAEVTVVAIDKPTFEDAHLDGQTASVTLLIPAKLITATRERAGTVIEGSAESVVDLAEHWTFARDTRSRDPNWSLVATGAPA